MLKFIPYQGLCKLSSKKEYGRRIGEAPDQQAPCFIFTTICDERTSVWPDQTVQMCCLVSDQGLQMCLV